MRYVLLLRTKNSRGSYIGWCMAQRTGAVIDHTPLNSKDLDAAVIEARRKVPRGTKVLVPSRGDEIPTPKKGTTR